MFGVRFSIHGGPQDSISSPPVSEIGKMREMLKCQQEKLNQLTESIDCLQNVQQYSHQPRDGPLKCKRCNEPGHFARECDGVHAPPQSLTAPI